jgi:iron complex outermembrane receptor protein
MTDIVNFKNTPLTKAIIALLAGSLSAVATAQTSEDSSMMLEEVVVTAERREANLQDVPISITAFSATDLADLQVWNLGDLQSLVPNLSIHVGDANNAVVYIRGVGQVDSVAFFEPGVGIYLDDVYLGRAQGAFLNVLDVERIEVLRGPQGTLYGRNTVGGAVKYISKAPTNEFEAEVETTFGNYNRIDLRASIGGAMVEDKLFGRLTVAQLGRDGYSDNVFDGNHDGDQDTFYARGVLRYDASDDLSIQIAADYTNSDPDRSRTPAKVTPINILVVDPYTFGLSLESFPVDEDPFLVNADFNTVEETTTSGIDINIAWDINDELTFKSITSYRDLEYGTEVDLDATPINAFGIFYFNDQTQWTQEFQLNYQSSNFSAVGGLYYFNEEGTTFDGGVFSNFLIALSGDSEFSTDSYAAFGQIDYDFNDKLTGIFGLRYTDEEKGYSRRAEDFDLTALAGIYFDPETFAVGYTNPELLNPGSSDLALDGGIGVPRVGSNPAPANFDNVSFKAGLKYALNDATQMYGTISQGFKSGGFNGRVSDGQLEPYDEETLDSYEIGMKSTWMDNRLRTNFAVFYMDYEDLQVSSFEASADGMTFIPVFTNAGAATIKGAEMELTALLSERLTLMANVGYLNADYDEFFAQPDPETGEVIDISDQREIVNSPKWDTFLGFSYSIPLASGGDVTFFGNWAYRSKTYLEVNSSENLAQGSYSLFDAAITWNSANDHWRVILGGKNLTDEEYRTHAFDLSAFPGVELGYYNPPRTYSITATYKF